MIVFFTAYLGTDIKAFFELRFIVYHDFSGLKVWKQTDTRSLRANWLTFNMGQRSYHRYSHVTFSELSLQILNNHVWGVICFVLVIMMAIEMKQYPFKMPVAQTPGIKCSFKTTYFQKHVHLLIALLSFYWVLRNLVFWILSYQ